MAYIPKEETMGPNEHHTNKEGKPVPEDDYAAHQQNPAPSPEAINERDDSPASKTIWIIVIVSIIVMTIIYFFFYY